jgi:hypothetical protein
MIGPAIARSTPWALSVTVLVEYLLEFRDGRASDRR